MATSLNRKLKSELLQTYYIDLKKIDRKIYWYDKLKKWQMTGYCDGCSPTSRFNVRLYGFWSATHINISIKKDYPFIKAVHLIVDDLIDYLDIDPEDLHEHQSYNSIHFRYKDLIEFNIYGSFVSCRTIYKEETTVERKIVGYECG
jgi:hypothetical protein